MHLPVKLKNSVFTSSDCVNMIIKTVRIRTKNLLAYEFHQEKILGTNQTQKEVFR